MYLFMPRFSAKFTHEEKFAKGQEEMKSFFENLMCFNT